MAIVPSPKGESGGILEQISRRRCANPAYPASEFLDGAALAARNCHDLVHP
jgi:hypothetical protein